MLEFLVMKEFNAHHPNGINMGPRRVMAKGLIRPLTRQDYYADSILTAIPSSFNGGLENMETQEYFRRTSAAKLGKPFLNRSKTD
jgi:hypothetical protein